MKIYFRPFIFIIIFLFVLMPVFSLEFKILKVGPNYVSARFKVQEGRERPELKKMQIYDVFEKMEIVDGKRVFVNFIDSVFLRDVKKDELYFGFVWKGENRILKSNYILSSTERFYTFPDIPFDQTAPEQDMQIKKEKEEKKSEPVSKAPGFAFMILAGYSLLHTLSYVGPVETPIDLGHITADIVVLLPFNLGFRLTGSSRHTFDEIYVQVSGINYRGAFNSFLKVYTELGAAYPFSISGGDQSEASFVLIAQYGLIFDFKGISKWGLFAIDLYAKGNFPINTILEGMYLDYGLKFGLRF